VCFPGGKAQTRHNLGAASLISFVMVAEVTGSSTNTFRTQANSSGMIEDEELSYREWNCFKHLERQREESSISMPLWKWPSSRRVEREETCTFVPPSLVVHILCIGVVEVKKNL
jgi:hypothetical protein